MTHNSVAAFRMCMACVIQLAALARAHQQQWHAAQTTTLSAET